MYLVKIGTLPEKWQKSMVKPLFFLIFSDFNFVVFYQLIHFLKPEVGLK